MKLTKQQLLTTLRDIITCIESDDSLEGGITYTGMEEGLQPGEFEVTASWRTGNSNGQGGCRIIRSNDSTITRMTLEEAHRMNLNGGFPDTFLNCQVLIFSAEHGTWWKAGGRGYTDNRLEAGQYTFADAYAATEHCGKDKKIVFDIIKA